MKRGVAFFLAALMALSFTVISTFAFFLPGLYTTDSVAFPVFSGITLRMSAPVSSTC